MENTMEMEDINESQQRLRNSSNGQAKRKNTPWFAYLLVGIGLGLMAGILVKLVNPTPIEIKLDNDQLQVIKSLAFNLAGAVASGAENVRALETITVRNSI